MDTTIASNAQKQLRVALLLNWRGKGYTRPHYGLVDDEELLRTGKSTFLSTDGRKLTATPADLLLLQLPVGNAVASPLLDVPMV
jgi:hypothetical protein